MKLVHFSIRVTPQLKRLLTRYAKRTGLGTSAYVRAHLELLYVPEPKQARQKGTR